MSRWRRPAPCFARALAVLLGAHLAAHLGWACARSAEPPPVPVLALAGVEAEVAEALRAARQAVVDEPTSGKAWGKLADHLFAHDFKGEAAACYARAEELDPESYLWPYRRGWCLQQEDPASAAVAFERSLRSLEQHAPAHAIYAKVLARVGRTDEALAHYARAAELDPSSAEPEAGLGLVHLARADFPAAREHLEAALARDERHVEAHAALAQVCFALGQERKAEVHAERARVLPQTRPQADVFVHPSVPPLGSRARTRHGQELEKQGRLDDAVEQYRAALRSNPDYYLARGSLANLLVARDQRAEALELLREAQRAHPSFERVRKDIERLESSEGGLERDEEE